MKVKSTMNGNVKIILNSQEELDALFTILNHSHTIDYGPSEVHKDEIENFSWDLFRLLDSQGAWSIRD